MSVSVYLWQPTLVPRPCIWVLHVKVGQWYKDLQGVSWVESSLSKWTVLFFTDSSWSWRFWPFPCCSWWWLRVLQTESCPGGPRGTWPVHSMLVVLETHLAPTAKGEEAAARAETTSAQCLTWTLSATAICSATAPCLTAAQISGITVWVCSHLSLVSVGGRAVKHDFKYC